MLKMTKHTNADNTPSPEILIVDDSVESLRILSTTLPDHGYVVRPAISGRLALASVAQRVPDMILLDVDMPDLNGYEICRRLKSLPECKDIPIIFISALEQPVDKVRAFNAGGIDYITKPFHPDELILRVHNQLALKKMHIALERSNEELEQRVKERTMALEIANKELRNEIAGRHRAQGALKESEEKYRLLFDHADVMVSVYDRDGVCQLMNHKVAGLFGGTPQEFIGKTFHELHPESAEEYTNRIRHTIDSGESREYEDKVTFPTGEHILLSRVHPIPDADGTARTAQIISHDITERIKAEKDKLRLEQIIHQNQKMEAMGTLANGVAHDFNNILFALSGYTELSFEFADENSILRANLNKIRQAINRASDLVKQILTFSRQVETKLQPIQPKLIVKEALNLLRASLPATLEFRMNIASDAYILADASQVHQVIVNLCVNAAHAMEPNGGVLIVNMIDRNIEMTEIRPSMRLSHGRHMVLSVTDTGSGIPGEIVDKIFDPYFSTKPQDKGTGLGLATVNGIINSYGGSIQVTSEPGEGSRFDVFIPIFETRGNQTSKEPEMEVQTGSETILLVDDEEALIDVCKKMLEKLGYSVTAMTDSRKALQAFKNKPEAFSLLITDYTMPHMTGVELAQTVHKFNPDLPILMISGNHDPIDATKATEMQIEGLLEKPLTQKDLSIQIRKLLDQGRMGASPEDGS